MDLVKAAKKEMYRLIDEIKIGKMQPVLMALDCADKCKNVSDEETWEINFEAKYKVKAKDIQMSVEEMAYQLYLELELANMYKND